VTVDPGQSQSLARRVRDELLTAMRNGGFAGGRLPPEAELAGRMGVSRTTIRAALQSLAEDGIISRRRRHGTVVNERMVRGRLPLNRLVSFKELVAQAGHEPSVDPLVRHVAAPDAEAGAALGLAPGVPCLTVVRLLRADGAPAIAVLDVVPLTLLVVAPEAVVDADSTFAFMARNTSATVDHSAVEIVPRIAAAHAPEHLELPAGMPYVELLETLFSPGRVAVAFSRIAVHPRQVHLTLSRRGG